MKKTVAFIVSFFLIASCDASNDSLKNVTFGQLLYNYANKEKKETLKSQKKVSIIEQIAANSLSSKLDPATNQLSTINNETKKKVQKINSFNINHKAVDILSNAIDRKQNIIKISNDKVLSRNYIDINKNIPLNWSVDKDQDLLNVLNKWGQTAGWDVVWKSDYSYRILSKASFNNIDFITAVHRLFESMGEINPRLYIKFYMGNKVLMISDKSDF